jgi:iron complex outermembrane receptor protein
MIGLELPVENIQQVEVIRGPGSAMYGADAFAGVINIITKKAKDIEGTTIGGRIGNWDTQSTWAQHGSHWAGWDVAASLQYQHTNGDDQRIINADSQSQIDSLLGTSASHAPGAMQTQFESWNAHLNLQRKHWDIGFWAFNAESGTRAGAAAALDLQGIGNAEQYMGSIRFSTEDWFQDWEFLAHASYLYSDFQTNQFQAFPDNTLLPIGKDGNINFTEPTGLTLFTQGVKDMQGRTQQVPSFEFSGIYKGFKDHRLRFQTGYRYEEIKTREIKNFGPGVLSGSPPPAIVYGAMTDVTGSEFVYLPDTSRSIWSLAIQDEWQIARDWQLTAGVRFDHYSDFGATVNPRLALVWDINEQLTSKLLYGRAFRAPNFSELENANNPVLLGKSDLDPEIINTVELAFDYRPFQFLRTGINLYY